MRTVIRRIRKLENHLGITDDRPCYRVILACAGWGLALDEERRLQILDECGFLSNSPGVFSVVNFSEVSHDLNEKELERYLRQHGDEISSNSARPPDKQGAR
jgi:hypothetical protein